MNPQDEIKKQCPKCGRWDVYRAYVEDGGMGDWCPHCKKSTDDRKRISPIIGIVGIFSVIIIYGIGNLILHYGQDFLKKPAMEKCELLEKELTKMISEIDIKKQDIGIKKENLILQEREIENLEKKLKYPEHYYNSDISYKKDYKKYKDLIYNYNNNVEKIKKMLSDYKILIGQYNEKVNKYNNMAKTAYTRWYIIPVPGKIFNIKK